MIRRLSALAFIKMATFNDPTKCFAPLEVIERILEIRKEFGFSERVYVPKTEQLTDVLDSFGLDIYAFETGNSNIKYGDYRSPIVPGGDLHHLSATAH